MMKIIDLEDRRREDGEPDRRALPELLINDSDPTATAKALAALIAKRDDFLFNGHAPVRITVEAGYLPRALEVTTEVVRVLAHEVCTPTKLRTKKDKDKVERIRVPLSKDIATLYLHGLEGSWGLKPFQGITRAPILADDGSIRIANGYDAATGLWCHNIPSLAVPEVPSKGQALAALDHLRCFFRTFPFSDSARVHDDALGVSVIDLDGPAGLDESAFLAALLTAICRQSLDFAPGLLCNGPRFSGAGTGKGLLVKAICIVASGVKPAAFTSGHSAEELDKRLTAALIEARPAVFLDNFNSKELKSDILASALTENPAEVRVMGQTKNVPLHTHTFISINGNAVEIAEDMARKLLNVRVDAHMENPEQRKFAPGFLDCVFTARSALLTDALTIWRWGRQNQMKTGKSLGSYETWGQWCRDPLLALGMRDPVDRVDEIKASDPRRRSLVIVFEAWRAAHGDTVIRANDLSHSVIELIDSKASRAADGTVRWSRQRVAGFLSGNAEARVGGYVLHKLQEGPASKPVYTYQLQWDAAAEETATTPGGRARRTGEATMANQ
jgi:hypothetical protein